MTLRQKFLEYAQRSLDEDLDLSWLPAELCGWFFWWNFDPLGDDTIPHSFSKMKALVIALTQEGLIERHPDNRHYVRIKC